MKNTNKTKNLTLPLTELGTQPPVWQGRGLSGGGWPGMPGPSTKGSRAVVERQLRWPSCVCMCVCVCVHSVISDSLRPHALGSSVHGIFPPGHSVHGIIPARMLQWVAIPFSRGSSPPRDPTRVSCIADRFFKTKSPGKP